MSSQTPVAYNFARVYLLIVTRHYQWYNDTLITGAIDSIYYAAV